MTIEDCRRKILAEIYEGARQGIDVTAMAKLALGKPTFADLERLWLEKNARNQK